VLQVSMLAHEGGWDEILLVAGPIVLIVGLLAVVKRRVDAQMPVGDDPQPDDEPVGDPGS
jgi:hypothetical protein